MQKTLRMLAVCCVMMLPSIFSSGCGYTMVLVHNIGLRETWGSADGVTNSVALVPLKESKMTVSVCVVACSDRSEDGRELGTYSFDVHNVRKDDASGPVYCFGRVDINMDGVVEPFDVIWWNDSQGVYEVSRRSRKWYGYPAQMLQIVAVPIDLVGGIVWFGAYGISQITHAEPSASPLPRASAGHSDGER